MLRLSWKVVKCELIIAWNQQEDTKSAFVHDNLWPTVFVASCNYMRTYVNHSLLKLRKVSISTQSHVRLALFSSPLLKRFTLTGWMLQECTEEILPAFIVWGKTPHFPSNIWEDIPFWILLTLWSKSELNFSPFGSFSPHGFPLPPHSDFQCQIEGRYPVLISPWNTDLTESQPCIPVAQSLSCPALARKAFPGLVSIQACCVNSCSPLTWQDMKQLHTSVH